ncbi:MAG: ribonuclease H-like domain-containing protein, partial [Acidobacteriaceae bacterium]|nr:ribonuclease H-like domain-containing protein [Acidobacteriaceae bacterium]
MNRSRAPFGRLAHLDLLYGARRLWKLRLDSCRLIQLEEQILGVSREGDLPGELIPYVYFEYLRSKEAQRVVPILHHNAIDILTLACLTVIVPAAFRSTDSDSLMRLGVRRGEELLGIARWLIAAEQYEQGLTLLKRAVDAGLRDGLLFRSLWDIALLEKRLGRPQAALALFRELGGCRNECRVPALEELAKFYEHEERNYALALEFTNQALEYGACLSLESRRARLQRRMAKPQRGRRVRRP